MANSDGSYTKSFTVIANKTQNIGNWSFRAPRKPFTSNSFYFASEKVKVQTQEQKNVHGQSLNQSPDSGTSLPLPLGITPFLQAELQPPCSDSRETVWDSQPILECWESRAEPPAPFRQALLPPSHRIQKVGRGQQLAMGDDPPAKCCALAHWHSSSTDRELLKGGR